MPKRFKHFLYSFIAKEERTHFSVVIYLSNVCQVEMRSSLIFSSCSYFSYFFTSHICFAVCLIALSFRFFLSFSVSQFFFRLNEFRKFFTFFLALHINNTSICTCVSKKNVDDGINLALINCDQCL